MSLLQGKKPVTSFAACSSMLLIMQKGADSAALLQARFTTIIRKRLTTPESAPLASPECKGRGFPGHVLEVIKVPERNQVCCMASSAGPPSQPD